MIAAVLALVLVATPAEPPAEEREAQAEDPREEVVCRTKLVPSHRPGQRFETRRTCKTRAEWDEQRNGNRSRN